MRLQAVLPQVIRLPHARADRRRTLRHLSPWGLLSLVDRLARNRLRLRDVPVLIQDAVFRLDLNGSAAHGRDTARRRADRHPLARREIHVRRRQHILGVSPAVGSTAVRSTAEDRAVRVTAAARAAAATASGPAAAAVTEPAAVRPAIRRRAVAVAMKCSEQSLEGTEAARALWTGVATVTAVAGVAAIGRIADPFAPVDFAAALAACVAAPHPGQNATIAAAIGARLVRPRPALAALAAPHDRFGQAETARLAASSAGTAGSRAAATTPGECRKSRDDDDNDRTSHHGTGPQGAGAELASAASYRPAKLAQSRKSS